MKNVYVGNKMVGTVDHTSAGYFAVSSETTRTAIFASEEIAECWVREELYATALNANPYEHRRIA
jgi:hypothetical protein